MKPSIAEKRRSFTARLRQKSLVTAPGVFDMISAKIADSLGFEALYMTGYGVAASSLGLPDAGIATYTEMVGRLAVLADGTQTAIIADADTGYGGLLNIERTVWGYESAGAVAVQLEDQEYPKKCGHVLGRRVIETEKMAMKIRVAVDTRSDKNFLVIARTDARTTLGLDEALRRAEAYLRAGADILFVESPESVEEMYRICQVTGVPQLANLVEGGRTPVLTRSELEQIGYRIAIFPASGFLATAAALSRIYQQLHDHGSSAGQKADLYSFQKLNELMGFSRVHEFERKYAETAS